MSTGRADYDSLIKVQSLQPDEPRFLLRAKDAVAAETVRAWAALAHEAGTPIEAIELALQQADAMEAWPDKKTPDGPDLTEAQAKQLRFQFGRRAWNARAERPDAALMMAEQLGASGVVGRIRPHLADLLARLERRPDGTIVYKAPGTASGHVDTALCPLTALLRLVGRELPAQVREGGDA